MCVQLCFVPIAFDPMIVTEPLILSVEIFIKRGFEVGICSGKMQKCNDMPCGRETVAK